VLHDALSLFVALYSNVCFCAAVAIASEQVFVPRRADSHAPHEERRERRVHGSDFLKDLCRRPSGRG